MKRNPALIVLGFCLILSCRTSTTSPAQASQPATDPALEAEREEHVQEVLQQIRGRENDPAEQVFKNIQVMKGVPAGRLLRIMNVGYSQALGVECSHCHVEDYWEVDEKRPKRAAREMIVMNREINQHVDAMKNLEGDDPNVNCTTCHRGQVRPAATVRR